MQPDTVTQSVSLSGCHEIDGGVRLVGEKLVKIEEQNKNVITLSVFRR